jgi:hypothetical protein
LLKVYVREADLDLLEETDKLFALGLGEGLEDVGDALEIVREHPVQDGAAFAGEDDVNGAAVVGIGLAGDEAVFFEGVDQACHCRPGDAGQLSERGGSGGTVFFLGALHAEEHQDGETPLADVMAGQETGHDGEDIVAGAEEVQEGVAGAGLKSGTPLGCLDEAVITGEIFEHQQRHGENTVRVRTIRGDTIRTLTIVK